MTQGSTVDANGGNTPQTVITNSPTVIVNRRPTPTPRNSYYGDREVGRLYAGGFGDMTILNQPYGMIGSGGELLQFDGVKI